MSDAGSRHARDLIEDALEATCDALITLESLCAEGGADGASQQLYLSQAVASLHRAVAELRLVHTEPIGIAALGFVCEPENDSEPSRQEDHDQARPRRTA